MRPRLPIASSAFVLPRLAIPCIFWCQNQTAQCALKAAIPQRMRPPWVNEGMLHLIVSSASGQPSCTSFRRCRRIGWAKGADLAM